MGFSSHLINENMDLIKINTSSLVSILHMMRVYMYSIYFHLTFCSICLVTEMFGLCVLRTYALGGDEGDSGVSQERV